MSKINTTVILSYSLAFVVAWFGINEISAPERWVAYVPTFLQGVGKVTALVQLHGLILILAGLSLILNFKRRVGASVIALMLVGIISTILSTSGLDEIAVRDIGLLGMALALALKN